MRGRGTYLGTNKEVFDAEVFAILQAVKLLNERGERGQAYTIFSGSQVAVARIQHSDCGPAQALARAVIEFSYELRQRDNSVTARWTPAHAGVEGNEHADAVAKRAAAGEEGRAEPEYLGRLVSPISREGPQTPGPWPPAAGSESMSGGSVDTAPHQGEGSARN